MNQIVTEGIIITRTDYGEADRIITLLTPDQGKIRLLAKGVRRVKSKLAGGIELFSVSTITFVRGRGEIGTLVSTRLAKHYGHIVEDLDRTMLGYELIKQLNRITEDEPGPEYFTLLQQAFEALDDSVISSGVIRLWFASQLLRLAGYSPNLQVDATGQKLQPGHRYGFNLESMNFTPNESGTFDDNHIKFLRLLFSGATARTPARVQGIEALIGPCMGLVQAMTDQCF